jgi:hypothetical protein
VTVAVIRPDDWDLPLFLHVAGAMLMVGTLLATIVFATAAGRGEGGAAAIQAAYRWLLLGVLPSWILMRVGAQWIASEENLEDDPPGWVDLGFAISEPMLLLVLAATIVSAFARRRQRASGDLGSLPRWVAGLGMLLVAMSLVAIWAMVAKPD